MPTYICSARAGALSEEQKAAIAQAITRIHNETTGAPTYFVQVIHEAHGDGDRYLGGAPASTHLWIRGDIRAGRTPEQRRATMTGIVAAVSAIAGLRASDVWVYLNVLEPTDMVEFGHVLPEPGGEQAWFEALPKDLQHRLIALGAASDGDA